MGDTITKKSVVNSFLYKTTERIGVKIIGFIISIILARLIDPASFGVLAIMMSIVAVMQVFVESGLNIALIQNKTTKEEDYSTVLYLSLSIAALIYTAIFFLAPAIMSFFNIKGYETHLRVLMIILFFYSYNAMQIAKLTRTMDFKKMLICQTIATVISGTMAIVCAYLGMGIWALIVHYLGNSIVSCITYSFITDWKPRMVFSVERARLFFGFGLKVLASGITTSIFYNLRTFAVGKFFSPSDLGFYSRGDQMPNIISSTVDSVFKSVMLPVYSRQQDNRDRILDLVRKTIVINSYINFPAMFGLSAIAPSLVILLYTDKWSACIPFLQVLSLACLSVSIVSPCLVSIQAMGKINHYVKLEVIRRVVMLVILAVSLVMGSMLYVAIGWLISSVYDVLIVWFFARKLINYRFKMLINDVGPSLVGAVIMYICIIPIKRLFVSQIMCLLAQILLGVAVYIGFSMVFKIKGYQEIKGIATERR